ncbi:Thioesterase-like superfamily protein [Marinobacter daqiaonensis]|uniref:Thioesterase-like superfamily protein n=1 Tax=Marinobacter daqiaonensis TaxID=650891 RepID=A0A1I6HFH5_9GAMM|nr:thioesterase family protein [Marinobacter daqiaonensis]SFR53236.1 Thioesterase-like superfamily protein [Marinobacter daqiaonensis]
MSELSVDSVFVREGDCFIPTELGRGPWSPDALHGGAPASLLAGYAEDLVDDPDMLLSRLTLELIRPVPMAAMTVTATMGKGRTVRRVELTLSHDGTMVAKALALFLRSEALDIDARLDGHPLPGPDRCHEPFYVPGMEQVTSFHYTAMEIRLAHGQTVAPGPAAAWFRLRHPIVGGAPVSAAMRAIAASDFGNGLSWILPIEEFTFLNTDLTVYLHRHPATEWVALDSRMTVQPNGIGLARSELYDEKGHIGMAQQNLIVRRRPPGAGGVT